MHIWMDMDTVTPVAASSGMTVTRVLKLATGSQHTVHLTETSLPRLRLYLRALARGPTTGGHYSLLRFDVGDQRRFPFALLPLLQLSALYPDATDHYRAIQDVFRTWPDNFQQAVIQQTVIGRLVWEVYQSPLMDDLVQRAPYSNSDLWPIATMVMQYALDRHLDGSETLSSPSRLEDIFKMLRCSADITEGATTVSWPVADLENDHITRSLAIPFYLSYLNSVWVADLATSSAAGLPEPVVVLKVLPDFRQHNCMVYSDHSSEDLEVVIPSAPSLHQHAVRQVTELQPAWESGVLQPLPTYVNGHDFYRYTWDQDDLLNKDTTRMHEQVLQHMAQMDEETPSGMPMLSTAQLAQQASVPVATTVPSAPVHTIPLIGTSATQPGPFANVFANTAAQNLQSASLFAPSLPGMQPYLTAMPHTISGMPSAAQGPLFAHSSLPYSAAPMQHVLGQHAQASPLHSVPPFAHLSMAPHMAAGSHFNPYSVPVCNPAAAALFGTVTAVAPQASYQGAPHHYNQASSSHPAPRLPKVADPELFDGSLRGMQASYWLDNMQLFWDFCMPTSPDKQVMYAVTRLQSEARAWHDNDPYLGLVYGRSGIACPPETFKARFLERFVLHDSTQNAYDKWFSLEQGSLDIQAFNDTFSQALQLVAIVPGGTPVDGASQVRRYMAVIRTSIRSKMLNFWNESYTANLPATMSLALHAERLMTLAGATPPAGTKRVAKITHLARKKSKTNSAPEWPVPAVSAPMPINTVTEQAMPMGSAPGRQQGRGARGSNRGGRAMNAWNQARGRGRQNNTGANNNNSNNSNNYNNQWPPQGQYNGQQGQGPPRGRGRAGFGPRVCPQPNSMLASQHPALVHAPVMQQHAQPAAQSALAQAVQYESSVPSAVQAAVPASVHGLASAAEPTVMASAHLTADQPPASALHMVFTASLLRSAGGRKGGQKSVRVLIDSGSQRCCINKSLATRWSNPLDLAETRIVFADGSSKSNVSSCSATLQMDGYKFHQDFLAVDTPDAFDVILGQDWMSKHSAELSFAQYEMKFKETDSSKQHIMPVPVHLRSVPLNSMIANTIAQQHQAAANGTNDTDSNPTTHMFMVYVTQPSEGSPATVAATIAAYDLHSVVAASVSIDNMQPHTVHANSAMMPSEAAPVDDAGTETLHVEIEGMRAEVTGVVQDFKDRFPSDMPAGLPPDRPGIAHTIPIKPGEHNPPYRKPYRLTEQEKQQVEEKVNELLEKGWIQPSHSPYGAPILFVAKKDGGLRMCVDYRALNAQTVKNKYPLPRIEDLLDELQGAKVFSCLDLQQAYHQVRLRDEDIEKTAFLTHKGQFEYRVLSFGLTNAPATFQALMNRVLAPFLGKFCLVYLDDVLIFSKDAQEHTQHLRQVLQSFREANFYCKLSKCKFAVREVPFLGHVVSEHGIAPDPNKARVINDWTTPKDKKELMSFLGLAQYFAKFIKGYSVLTVPLTNLLRKNVEWDWTEKCEYAFAAVKHSLAEAPVLALPDPNLPFELVTDACGTGVGAVLLQDGKPIAFAGRKLNDAETRYSVTDQELLAVIFAVTQWRCYLQGARHAFTLVTDHNPNTYFATQPNLSRRQVRWSDKLQDYDFAWEYRPGKTNVADPISRQVVQQLHACVAAGLQQLGDFDWLEKHDSCPKVSPALCEHSVPDMCQPCCTMLQGCHLTQPQLQH